MMSKNTEISTNNAVTANCEQNMVAVAAATDLTTALNKQRKKRKKKKDKLLLTNNVAPPPPPITTVLATAAATTAPKDTQQICSCSNRYENSCNSISTCLNCVQCACVYCHFNDLAAHKSYCTKHLTKFSCDYCCELKKKRAAVQLWPNTDNIDIDLCDSDFIDENRSIEESSHCLQAISTPYRNGHSLNRVNRRIEQLQRFAVYENLCGFCGFAIGNGIHHLNCSHQHEIGQTNSVNRFGNDVNELNANESAKQTFEENIYENICESCHLIFDGVQCTSEICTAPRTAALCGDVIEVLVKKPPIANRQFGKQFSEFLGSFKQKLSKEKPTRTNVRKRKIEIVHNLDEVFKTNQTFDLNEIVRLKNESRNSVYVENAGYGKLKKSSFEEVVDGSYEKCLSQQEHCVLNKSRDIAVKPIRLVRTSTSESNFFQNFKSSPQLQSPYSESIASDTILYSNSYAPPSYEDAIQNSDYARVNPFKLTPRLKPKVYDSTSASSFFTYNSSSTSTLYTFSTPTTTPTTHYPALFTNDSSLKHWMTSLKWQTHDYNDDNKQFECDSIKCVPSKLFNSTQQTRQHTENCVNMNSTRTAMNSIDQTQMDLLQRIELFKMNLIEHRMHSKRNAIYIKDSICYDSIGNYVANTENNSVLLAQSHAPDIDTNAVANSSSCSITNICSLNQSESAQNNDDIVCLRPKNQYDANIAFLAMGIPLPKQNTNDTINTLNNAQQTISHDVALATTTQYLQMLKAFYMSQIALSTSLNRITLVCGDNRWHCFVNVLVNHPQCEFSLVRSQMKLVQPTKYIDLRQIIEILYKLYILKQLSDRRTKEMKKPKNHLVQLKRDGKHFEDFVMRSTNLLFGVALGGSAKCSIDDFVVKQSPPITYVPLLNEAGKQKSIDDFNKANVEATNICNKTLNDFAKKSDCSSKPSTSTPTKQKQQTNERIKNQTQNDENIYQPIWMFKTIGTASDTSYDEDSLNNFDDCANVCDEIGNEWDLAEEEFLFFSNRIDSHEVVSHSLDADIHHKTLQSTSTNNIYSKPIKRHANTDGNACYKNVCVLYNPGEVKWNKIIYDYNGNSSMFNANLMNCVNQIETNERKPLQDNLECWNKNVKKSNIPIKFDSINAWKSMLRTVDYNDDEEDVILSESYLLDKKSAEYNNENNQNIQAIDSLYGAVIKVTDEDASSDITKSSIHSGKTEYTDLSSNPSINDTTPPTSLTAETATSKKESKFFNKLQHKRFDVTKSSSKKDDTIQGLFYKNLNGKTHTEPSPPMEIKKLQQSGNLVFGVELDAVEKDDKLHIPKFVVECIKIIELEENLRTDGIYRASGKKDSIDKLRKKMNESKLRKGTKYVSIKDEDVHAVTGALKQFFRELKTELIPSDIINYLPDDLETDESLVHIRNKINAIDHLSRETLKYLLQHLIKVDANNQYNLMTASNLSIVWGASIFTSSVNIAESFEKNDLMRRNTLVKVLIQRYNDIFVDIDERLI